MQRLWDSKYWNYHRNAKYSKTHNKRHEYISAGRNKACDCGWRCNSHSYSTHDISYSRVNKARLVYCSIPKFAAFAPLVDRSLMYVMQAVMKKPTMNKHPRTRDTNKGHIQKK